MEDQAHHIVGQIREHDLGLGTLEGDCADEQPHMQAFAVQRRAPLSPVSLTWLGWLHEALLIVACPVASCDGSG